MAILIIRIFLLGFEVYISLIIIKCILAAAQNQFVKGNVLSLCECMQFGIQFFRKTDGFGNIGSCKLLVNSEHGIYLWLFFYVLNITISGIK